MPRGRAQGYDEQREQILSRAARLFARRGYTATTMNEVAEACGVSKPSLYHYVRDKHQLLVEIAAGAHRAARGDRRRGAGRSARARSPGAPPDRAFLAVYAEAQAEHRVLTEDVKFLQPADRRRILDGERKVVAAFADAIADARPGAARRGARQAAQHAAVRHDELDVHVAEAARRADPRRDGTGRRRPLLRRPRRRPPTSPAAALARSPRHRSGVPAMSASPILQSHIADRWVGARAGSALASAIDGSTIHHTHADEIDFGEALLHARRTGVPALMAMDFQQRAARLKALAAYMNERKEALYAISRHTGATRNDSWVDIEGGTGTLYAYASMGSNELPSGNVVHEGPAVPLGKKGHFAGTHILVPRGGVAVHINAFNFPVWGLLEKFAPTFLAGMPCIAKPATATSYLTEAVVRMMVESGLLPRGQPAARHRLHRRPARPARQPGRRHLHRLGRHRAEAARQPQPAVEIDSFQRRSRLAQRRDPRARRDARRRGVRSLRQGGRARDDRQGRPEMHGDPPRHRAAPAPRRGRGAAARAARQGRRRRPGGRGREDGRAGLDGAAQGRHRARRAAVARQRGDVRSRRWLRAASAKASPRARSSRRRFCSAATR